jgi:hypothetical protein
LARVLDEESALNISTNDFWITSQGCWGGWGGSNLILYLRVEWANSCWKLKRQTQKVIVGGGGWHFKKNWIDFQWFIKSNLSLNSKRTTEEWAGFARECAIEKWFFLEKCRESLGNYRYD